MRLSTRRFFSARWLLYWLVLLGHVLALIGLNMALTVNRLSAQVTPPLEVALLAPETTPESLAPPTPPKPTTPAQAQTPKPELAEAMDASHDTPPQRPEQLTEQAPSAAVDEATAPSDPAPVMPLAKVPEPSTQALKTTQEVDRPKLNFKPPAATELHYVVTKDNTQAKATLRWQPKPLEQGEATPRYEMSYEATYFGLSIIKQNSVGTLESTGLAPIRFSDQRRGRAAQATHFDYVPERITFSNNHPSAPLTKGAQDRASFLIQLAALFAGQPELLQEGQLLTMPVASVDELETWTFEVQSSEALALPIGTLQATRVLRRPRKSFDQTVEVWFAPQHAYLPVRIRLTDSSGATDSQLSQ